MSSACGVRLCAFPIHHVNKMGYWRENTCCDQPMTDTEIASTILFYSITISILFNDDHIHCFERMCLVKSAIQINVN